MLHWDGKQSVPCEQGAGLCQHCLAQKKPFWGGYVAALDQGQSKPGHLFIPAGAFFNSESLKARDGHLRGLQLDCKRLGKNDNSPLRITAVEPTLFAFRTMTVPQVDLIAGLARMWHLKELVVDGDNAPLDNGLAG